MPAEQRAVYRALEEHVVGGDGTASVEERALAFANDGLDSPLAELIGNVVDRPTEVTSQQLDSVKASGLSEDQIFELVVCAAVGRSARMYDAGLAALAEARRDHAS